MTTTQYTSLCNHWNLDSYKKKREVAQRNCLQGHGGQGLGKHTGGSRSFIECLKANVECLHIETGLPIPSDKELMFEAASVSNKGHVNGFSSKFGAIIGSVSIFCDWPQLDLVLTLFPPFPLIDDATSDAARVDPRPPTNPPSFSGPSPLV
ncbi:hypothetical protein M9H77_17281 [Catharanthus roseus]|uniref:Uncharacterized protein n=1 Tax=Catharanthus roseus TaxID=4058 RepID=A0ACC0B461_CATRO|nr:hypothetical protein M9H77_17281 [Catharanthus roseus]